MRFLIGLSLLAFLALLVLFPILFGELMAASLRKLQLSPGAAILIVLGIFFGGLVNIPVRRIPRDGTGEESLFTVWGLPGPVRFRRSTRMTTVAVNLGGCIIPSALVVYELALLGAQGGSVLFAALAAAAVNIGVCHAIARPMPGLGIGMPGFVPPLVAAALALLLAPEAAPPVAFIAGVLGPLIGADLLHLKDIGRIGAGMVSIGGAGTFDGIVLSGIIAAYLA